MRKRSRKLEGVQVRQGCLMAAVKVAGKTFSRSFPLGTDAAVIAKWRADERLVRKTAAPSRGSLAGNIARYLATLSGRKLVDLSALLNAWNATPLALKDVTEITEDDIRQTLEGWRSEFSNASLNRRRQALLSMWGKQGLKLKLACPASAVDKYDESKPRQGFFEAAQFERVVAELPEKYRPLAVFAYASGWRRGEIEDLRWCEVDLEAGLITLSADRSKNGEPRDLPISVELRKVLDARAAVRGDSPLVFGVVGDWRKAWASACKRAGCPGKLFHDFRRTVARDLLRAGVPQRFAMGITGHKTDSVFRRYAIVDPLVLRDASDKLAAFRAFTSSVADLGQPVGQPSAETLENRKYRKTRTLAERTEA